MAHPIENIVRITMENLQHITAVDTVVGRPVAVASDTAILPVSRVSMGFFTGGGEYDGKNPLQRSGRALDDGAAFPFAGATAAGIAVTPVSFLAVRNGQTTVLPAEQSGALERIVEMIPQVLAAAERWLMPKMQDGDEA